MKSKSSIATIITTGLAMFSMYFGAGNVIFPLSLGQYAQDKNFYAIIGFIITAVGVPFIGLLSMTLFNGNYKHFFERIGKVPGFIVALLIMALIGPFGAAPRLITVSYATVSMSWDGLSLMTFSILSSILIFLLTFRKSRILDILGYFLTPVLLISLAIIIVKGLLSADPMVATDRSVFDAFYNGLESGYMTMDLAASLFFASIVLGCLENEGARKNDHKDYRNVIFMTLKAGIIGVSLLAITYAGFSYVAAYHNAGLEGISADRLLGTLAINILGPYASLIAIVAVTLACLTTAIALAVVFTEYLHYDIFNEKVGYLPCLVGTLIVNCLVSIQGFSAIANFLTPILIMSYPALIMLSIMNIAYKLRHIKLVKTPVAVTFILSVVTYYYL